MRLILTSLALAVALFAQDLKPKAFLRARYDENTKSSAYYIAVFPDPPIDPKADLSSVSVVLYGGSSTVIATRLDKGNDATAAPFTVEIAPQDQKALLDAYDGLSLVSRYRTAGGATASSLTSVGLEVSVAIDDNPFCKSGLMLAVGTNPKKPELSNAYTQARRHRILGDIAGIRPLPAKLQKAGQTAVTSVQISLGDEANDGSRLFRCAAFTPPLQAGKYRFELGLTQQPFVELSGRLTGETEVAAADAAPSSIDDGDVGDRSLERNLDLGVQFTSAVKDSGDPPTRERTNQGTLDLRLAPLLNLLPNPVANDTVFLFYTPFFVDARISTGHITEDNLSQNRINIGSDFEIRKYPENAGSHPNFWRVVLGARNGSDRDFHQAEFKGVAEFLPVFGALNHPLGALKPKRIPWVIKLDPEERDKNEIEPTKRFGWQVLPVLGGEFGRIYRNHFRPATVIVDETVRRFYFGASVSLDFTKFFTMSAEDRLYVRGEAKDDRLHNYLKAALQFSLPTFTRHAAHGLFISFERGNQPPFATPNVNAVKSGYRVQWDDWFGKWR